MEGSKEKAAESWVTWELALLKNQGLGGRRGMARQEGGRKGQILDGGLGRRALGGVIPPGNLEYLCSKLGSGRTGHECTES